LVSIQHRFALRFVTFRDSFEESPKTNERWPIAGDTADMFLFFDEGSPHKEQLPRSLQVRIFETEKDKRAQMEIYPDGVPLGDPLTDNAYEDDGYRFHDVMHLANLAVLGWSPLMRKLLNRKRKSQPKVDEVEDGARAILLEELVIAFVYGNAKERKYYENIKHLDSEMLSTIKRIVAHLEVGTRRTKDWEQAVFQGYAAFRHLLDKREAVLHLDLKRRELIIVK